MTELMGTEEKEFEDEIIEEWDVFIGTELTPFLHLTPLPTATLSSRLNAYPSVSMSTAMPWRFKPRARRLEFGLAFDDLGSESLQGERMRELQMGEKGQKLIGSGWQWRRVQYLLGRFSGNRFTCSNSVSNCNCICL